MIVTSNSLKKLFEFVVSMLIFLQNTSIDNKKGTQQNSTHVQRAMHAFTASLCLSTLALRMSGRLEFVD